MQGLRQLPTNGRVPNAYVGGFGNQAMSLEELVWVANHAHV